MKYVEEGEDTYNGIELTDILRWIVEHREDTQAMDDIQGSSFPYSTRGRQYSRSFN